MMFAWVALFSPRNWLLFLVSGIAVLFLLGLGSWQMDRLAWKEALIEARLAAVTEAPLTEPPSVGDSVGFRRLRLMGRFDPVQEFYLTGQTYTDRRGGSVSGWHIVTPFYLTDGRSVMVDRGFVPFDRKAPGLHAPPPQTATSLDAIIAPKVAPDRFTPANDPDKNLWFTLDPEALARAAGLKSPLPFALKLLPQDKDPETWPRAEPPNLDLPNNHLHYALTWYALAGVLVVITGVFAHSRAIPRKSTLEKERP